MKNTKGHFPDAHIDPHEVTPQQAALADCGCQPGDRGMTKAERRRVLRELRERDEKLAKRAKR